MQSLAAIMHYDFNQPDAYSYEQAIQTIRQLGLPMSDVEQQVRRAALNLMARNQDDHVKNIAFLMDRSGQWSLSPAFDLTYSFNPSGAWTAKHQMTMNGKRENFTLEDFKRCANVALLKRGQEKLIIDEVLTVVSNWRTYASQAGIGGQTSEGIFRTFRLDGFK